MGHPTNTQIKNAVDKAKQHKEKKLKELEFIKKNGIPAGLHIESGWADEERKQND